MIEKVYRDYLNDVPHYIIHQELKDLGFPHTAKSSVFRILNNPLYCGLVRVCAHGNILKSWLRVFMKGLYLNIFTAGHRRN